MDPREVELISIWEELALRQQRKRQTAEAENASLREMLENQNRVAKELMRFLQIQPREEDIPGIRVWRRLQSAPPTIADASYDGFASRMDALYEGTASVFDPAHNWVSRRNVRDVRANYQNLGAVEVEIRLAWVVPFSQEAVTRVFREHLVRFETRAKKYESLPEKDRTVVTMLGGSTKPIHGTGIAIPCRLISRYYPDGAGAVIVSDLKVEPSVCLGEVARGYGVQSDGWVRITPYRPNGLVLKTPTTQHLTHIQTLRRTRFTPLSAAAPGSKKHVATFTEAVLDFISLQLDESQQNVEELLANDISSDDKSTDEGARSASPSSLGTIQPHHETPDADVAFQIVL